MISSHLWPPSPACRCRFRYHLIDVCWNGDKNTIFHCERLWNWKKIPYFIQNLSWIGDRRVWKDRVCSLSAILVGCAALGEQNRLEWCVCVMLLWIFLVIHMDKTSKLKGRCKKIIYSLLTFKNSHLNQSKTKKNYLFLSISVQAQRKAQTCCPPCCKSAIQIGFSLRKSCWTWKFSKFMSKRRFSNVILGYFLVFPRCLLCILARDAR